MNNNSFKWQAQHTISYYTESTGKQLLVRLYISSKLCLYFLQDLRTEDIRCAEKNECFGIGLSLLDFNNASSNTRKGWAGKNPYFLIQIAYHIYTTYFLYVNTNLFNVLSSRTLSYKRVEFVGGSSLPPLFLVGFLSGTPNGESDKTEQFQFYFDTNLVAE